MTFLTAHCMEQDMMTRLATGVFLRSVITILGSPPSATLQRYMCRNDLPLEDMTWGYCEKRGAIPCDPTW